MLNIQNISALRMQRQHLTGKANETEYKSLYRDTSPGQNVYWCGFGDPPSMTFRADFDDIEYNRERQKTRELVKGRFQGGNLGWIEQDDLEMFTGLCRKPLDKPTPVQMALLELIEREGPMNIQLMKEMTGFLVKEITPVLHRLQEAFLVYEDQYDGEWDRGWYKFSEMFPDLNVNKYTRHEALKIVLKRFAYRLVLFDTDMAKSFYRLPARDIKTAADELVQSGEMVTCEDGYMLKSDFDMLQKGSFDIDQSVFVLHRNDFLVKSNEHLLKVKYKHPEYDILQYILIDGEFRGAVMGHFKNGPYVIEDIILESAESQADKRKDEIIEAVYRVNNREYSPIKRFMGTCQMHE